MAKKLIRDYVFSPGAAGAGFVRIPGRYAMDQVLVVTNGTRNIVNYSFADSAYTGTTANGAGSVNDRLDLTQLKELTGAPLGGDFKYPDGSDILAINVRLTAGTAQGHVLLRWSEAQA